MKSKRVGVMQQQQQQIGNKTEIHGAARNKHRNA
jgi:hypothetical protein